ncbi:2-keto-4-pentenoate hydratase [Burkholderiales bacterium]|nr:2-keto-4-pentenoate hydratase [Burkholderiales bacterium]
MPSSTDRLAQLLSAAHRSGRAAATTDLDPLNVTIAEAYAAQAVIVRALGARVAGWKTGFGPDGSPVAAPLVDGAVRASGSTVALPPDRPVILEIEIAFRLARDLPPRPQRPYTRGEVEDAVEVALAGAELIAARGGMPSTGTPFPRFVADLQGNAGYVCGGETRGFRTLDLRACRVSLRIDGERVHDAVGGHPQGDPWAPIVAWANAQCDGLGGLRAGQVVTTGSITPPRPVDRPCRVQATIEGVGDVDLALSAPVR